MEIYKSLNNTDEDPPGKKIYFSNLELLLPTLLLLKLYYRPHRGLHTVCRRGEELSSGGGTRDGRL